MVNEDNDSGERGRSMTRRIVTTNITFNRLCNYFPNMTDTIFTSQLPEWLSKTIKAEEETGV